MSKPVVSFTSSLMCVAMTIQSVTAQETLPQTLPLVEEIITEEAFAETYVNYKAAPESIDYTPIIQKQNLQDLSEVSLIVELNKVADALKDCQSLRQALEVEIGDRPGSYSVNKVWVKKYQNCALALVDDLKRGEQKIRYLQNRIAREALRSEAPESSRTTLIPDLQRRLADVKKQIQAELLLQNDFVEYFNTGKKGYTE